MIVRPHLIRGAVVAAALLAVLQLVPVERINPPVTAALVAPADVQAVLRGACFDCHSNETRWPWYSRVAPISWWMAEHVADGRKHLNFSRWPVQDVEEQADLRREIAHEIEEDAMPLRSYRLGHPEARLDAQQKALLLAWARAGG